MKVERITTLCGALFFGTAAAEFERERLPTREELTEANAWFEHVTVPEVAGVPYVEIVTQRFRTSDGKLHEQKRRGFLLAEDGDAWTLVPDGTPAGRERWFSPRAAEKLWPVRVRKPRESRPTGASPDRRNLDLRKIAAAIFAEVERPPAAAEPVYSRSFRGGGHAAIFLLARLCERAGRANTAAQLDRALFALPLTIEHDRMRERIPPLRMVIEQEIGWVLLRATLAAFADEAVPRSELLARLEQIAREFSRMEEIERVRDHAATLRRMGTEEARRAHDLAALTPLEQAREWIYRLRDQTAEKHGGFSSGAKISVLESPAPAHGGTDYARDDPRPAQQLLNLGHAAVPALIEALSDTRLTRAIQTSNMQPSLPKVLTVADCAEEILERISGRAFWWERVQGRRGESKPEDAKAAVEQWWGELRERGEPTVMAEAIRRGDHSSMEQVRRLAQLDPAAAAAALPEGIRHAESGGIRETLIDELANVGGEGARIVLAEEMIGGRWLQSRVAAARALEQRGDAGALPAMIDEWRRWTPPAVAERNGDFNAPEPLVRFLLRAARVEAVQVLEERFAALSVTTRVLVLETCGRTPLPVREGDPEAHAARLALERFLLCALDDREVNPAITFGGGDRPSWNARVCDHAASALHNLRGEACSGPREPSRAARDALIVRLKKAPLGR